LEVGQQKGAKSAKFSGGMKKPTAPFLNTKMNISNDQRN
jgi:hypothetical protein